MGHTPADSEPRAAGHKGNTGIIPWAIFASLCCKGCANIPSCTQGVGFTRAGAAIIYFTLAAQRCSAWPRTNKEQNDSDWEQPACGANHIAARCQQRASAARHAACELLLQPLCLPSHQEQLSLTLSHYSSGSALPMLFFLSKQAGVVFCFLFVCGDFHFLLEKGQGRREQ